jgi:hypothetical protein
MTASAAPSLNSDIGRVMSRLAGMIARNLVLFGSLALLLVGLPGAVLAIAQVSMMSDMFNLQGAAAPEAAFANLFSPLRIGLGVAAALIGIIGNAALQGAVIHGSVSDLSGKRATFGECLSTGLRFFWPLFCIGLIVAICCFFGYLVFVVPGVLLGLAWCMAAPAEVIERTGIFASLSRSADLTRNHRAAIFGLIIIFFASVFVVQLVINAVDTIGFGVSGGMNFTGPSAGMSTFFAVQSAVAVILQVVISSLASAGLAATYFELRQAKEGVGVDQLAAVFD